jgi:PAS domain S-box-containing protein
MQDAAYPATDMPAIAAFADVLPSLIFIARPDGSIVYVNLRYAHFTGQDAAALNGTSWHAIVHPDDQAIVDGGFAGTAPFEAELRLRGANGEYCWFLVRTTPVCDAAGKVMHSVGNAADIDALKRAQAALSQALITKEALLHEVSHRVKNSLQLVTALLSLQAAQTAEPNARYSVIAARNRIAVVAGVHRRLHWENGGDRIDIAGYLGALVEETMSGSPRAPLAEVSIVAPEPVTVSLTSAVPLALILSELVCNAVNHGIRDDGGKIEVAMHPGERLVATVRDDGVGLPAEFDPRTSRGLGMRIVAALGRQAKADVSVVPQERGACFKVEMAV